MKKSFKLVIIDYGMGNLRSIKNALNHIGNYEISVSSEPREMTEADCLILPGVGAFPDAIKKIKEAKLIELLNELVLVKKKPLLGICLGMQLLFESSEEGGSINNGLGWIPGKIKYMKPGVGLRVPHIGWNSLKIKKENNLFSELGEDKNFYFVHSLHADCDDEYLLAAFEYGQEFTAAVQKDNIVGMQFHPEKSQKNGLAVMKQFILWAGGQVYA